MSESGQAHTEILTRFVNGMHVAMGDRAVSVATAQAEAARAEHPHILERWHQIVDLLQTRMLTEGV